MELERQLVEFKQAYQQQAQENLRLSKQLLTAGMAAVSEEDSIDLTNKKELTPVGTVSFGAPASSSVGLNKNISTGKMHIVRDQRFEYTKNYNLVVNQIMTAAPLHEASIKLDAALENVYGIKRRKQPALVSKRLPRTAGYCFEYDLEEVKISIKIRPKEGTTTMLPDQEEQRSKSPDSIRCVLSGWIQPNVDLVPTRRWAHFLQSICHQHLTHDSVARETVIRKHLGRGPFMGKVRLSLYDTVPNPKK
ncbi:unnamed protein product [Bursaphelenchus okinawaensis]|uniref:Uncharacterized protein n=1 Tax=Bursaphelenchus okinawaensis TaxID=465554 RepID=A0A811JQA8_9BILA|nr:unnamed protein product [Bursaphelenchus okinawaensis]CAG9077507.1 unnamed protein product [Bursaphelenchus okinawaensis]